MKFLRQLSFLSRFRFCLLGTLFGAMFLANAAAQPNSKVAIAAQNQKAFTDATAFFKNKDYATGQTILFSTNRHASGTLGWDLESAGKLTQMALSSRQRYDYPGAEAVAKQALAVLDDAEKLAKKADVHQQARVFEMEGFLQDELFHDLNAAIGAYEKALKADPSSVRAQQELARLQEEKDKGKRLKGKN